MSNENNQLEPTKSEDIIKKISVSLNAIPHVGGMLSNIATEVIERRQNRRLNNFLLDLSEKLNQLWDKVNKDFISKEEFEDLVEDIFTKVADTRKQQKIDALRNIFLNTILSDNPNYDEASEIADLVYRWQDRHIIMLKILSTPEKADNEMNNVIGKGNGSVTSISQIFCKLLPEWGKDQIERTWKDLYDDNIHRTPGSKSMFNDTGIDQLKNRLSPFGVIVSKYIEEVDNLNRDSN